VVADLNHDGRVDVAVASRDDSSLFVFYQQRNGGLGESCVLATAGASWLTNWPWAISMAMAKPIWSPRTGAVTAH